MGSYPAPSVFTRLSTFGLLLVPVDAARLGGYTLQKLRGCAKIQSTNGLHQKTNRSIVAESTRCPKDGKNVYLAREYTLINVFFVFDVEINEFFKQKNREN